jgi:hypothetical protein
MCEQPVAPWQDFVTRIVKVKDSWWWTEKHAHAEWWIFHAAFRQDRFVGIKKERLLPALVWHVCFNDDKPTTACYTVPT